jgi:hypothetical protein
MVIIDVKEGYPGGCLRGNAGTLCRSEQGCGELVEVLFYRGISRVLAAANVEIVPRGTFRDGSSGLQ